MIRSSREVIKDLIRVGVEFEKKNGEYVFTKEGAHSKPRILYHKDITGKEITGKLLETVKKQENITLLEYTTMVDLLCRDNCCYGVIAKNKDGELIPIEAKNTVLACGGLGGIYEHTTNYAHLTGDALAISAKRGIVLENMDYIQIHPTTLYSKNPGRRFLISESVRGEGAILYNVKMERFVNELLPRDLLTMEIHKKMEKDQKPYVWLSMMSIELDTILNHFPNIYRKCLEEGYDVTRECIPVVPAQHYFMGGIQVDSNSQTSMRQLYAIGETSCNGVHGANRLASNSLLESLVFAKRAAKRITTSWNKVSAMSFNQPLFLEDYEDFNKLQKDYIAIVKNEIERAKEAHEKSDNHENKCRQCYIASAAGR
jgi:L-aspartate oxidase